MVYAMFAMILVTFVVGIHLFRLRLAAVRSGKVSLGSFRLNNAADIPSDMLQAARNYSNLFEIPLLFYAAGILTIALRLDSPTLVLLGWIFVGTRILHSWIHLTTNNVIQRMQMFMAGNACVLLMWILIVLKYSALHF